MLVRSGERAYGASPQGLAMRLSFVQPRPELKPYIESFWVFESPVGMPVTDTSMAAPNGCSKLIIPCENSLVSRADERTQVSHEGGLYFVGNRDTQTTIHSSARKTGFVVIEFSPHGAYPFFGVPMEETVNGLFDAETVFGKWGREVRETLRNLEVVDRKVNFIEDQLVALIRKGPPRNTLIEFCVGALRSSRGRVAIGELERRTGYSRRYLDMLFNRHIGLSPKVLAGIFRFQTFYRKWARGLPYDALKEELYEYYYDQAHFTKEFKKMTGYSPQKFILEVSNEFGRRLSLK
jgi:AraC-like DNA-binding protein